MKSLARTHLALLSAIYFVGGMVSISQAVVLTYELEIANWSTTGDPPYDTGKLHGTFAGNSRDTGSGFIIELSDLTAFEMSFTGSSAFPEWHWALEDVQSFFMPVNPASDWGFTAESGDGIALAKVSIGPSGFIDDTSSGAGAELIGFGSSLTLVPEPAIATLATLGLLGLFRRRR